MRGPAVSLPMCSQFFRLCAAQHNAKNWLFIGEAAAGERAAILYTIVENCRRHGLDTEAYLREVFTQLPGLTNQTIKHWIPAAYAQAQRLKRKAAGLRQKAA